MIDLIKTFLAFTGLMFSFAVNAAAIRNSEPLRLAPGYSELKYPAPIPGAYRLPLLGLAADGDVIDSEGRATTLHRLMGNSGKVVLLSFIYSTCNDVNGCPLATGVLHKLKNRLKKDPETASRLMLITLSFNPENDTPDRMKAFGSTLQDKGLEWLFLTTRSEQELQPILKAYKQTVEKIYDADGNITNT